MPIEFSYILKSDVLVAFQWFLIPSGPKHVSRYGPDKQTSKQIHNLYTVFYYYIKGMVYMKLD